MKQIRKLIFLLAIVIVIFIIVYVFFKRPNLKPVKGQLDDMDLTNYNKVMIISHPSDETIYGGVHLLSDNYVVVCASCGVNKNKDEDLENVLNQLKGEYERINAGYQSEKSRKYSELMSNYASEATQIVKNIDNISETVRDYNRKMKAIDES